ncbi:MAG: DUF11 domain-containing protein [Anaerolineae bacterium]|nr:DUF11 domain-containing protein [Anaerolineae bacterium]
MTLVSGENDPTWDAGIYQLSSLGDRVWEDVNLNGTQDGGEPGVAGVGVTLYLNGVAISSTTTDASGFYGFFNLTPTVPYTLAFALPAGYTGFTKVDVGSEGTDSDADPITGVTGPVTLLPGENNPNVDAGVVKPAGLGDFVWVDVNRDGKQDASESGVPGVVVTLYASGQPIGTATTNASGYYSFTGLAPGVAYSLSFGLPGGFAWTQPTVGITTTDSNADSNGNTGPVTLVSGEYNPTIDAGVISMLRMSKKGVGSGINGAIGKDKLITYTLLITNTGAGAISNVVVDDPLPVGLIYADKSTPSPASTNPLKWNLGTLNVGETKTIVFVVTAIVNTGTLTNTAYVNGPLGNRQILMAQDDAMTPFAPDAVALMRFEAKREKSGVRVIWQTSQEVNTFGFALYRSANGNRSDAVLATAELIPAQGRTGGSYAWLDVNVKANARYTYWLIEAETTGAMNENGPVQTDGGTNGTDVAVALQPSAVAVAGGVPVAGLPAAVAVPVKELGQRVLIETQPQTVNAVVAQQAAAQQSSTSASTSSASTST